MQAKTRHRVLSMVLAGGEGKRLLPLTGVRAKPAVPFGGHYRLIDFALSNLANGGFRKIVVLTQYKSHSLDVHITRTWRLSTMLGNYVTTVPAQMRRGPHWFAGSADAIFQNLNLVDDERPEYIFVFGADHIYRMDPAQMLEQHIDSGAGVTVAAIRVPQDQAQQFGVIDQAPGGTRIEAFREKPDTAVGLADDPTHILASMGNYVFTAKTLVDLVKDDALDPVSNRDVGGNLIPTLVEAGDAHVYDFTTNQVPGETSRDRHYWRDVGTIDSYYEAHMDLVAPLPVFNLYNRDWPVYTAGTNRPPAKIVADGRRGPAELVDAIVCSGAVVSGGTVRNSVLSPGVRVEAGAVVEGSILLDDVVVGPDAVIRDSIIDKNVMVPARYRLGRGTGAEPSGLEISPGGITVVAKNRVLEGH